MKRKVVSFRSNAKLARQLWGAPSRIALRSLRELTARYSLSVAAGDLQLLDGRWYVTHSGLLQLASRRGCTGINTMLQDKLSDLGASRWVFKAIVYKSRLSKGFVGYGDADPSNVSSTGSRCRDARSPKLALSTAPSVRPTGSASARSRSWVGSRRAANLRSFRAIERVFLQRKRQRSATAPRPTLPSDPPVQPRSESREGLCGRFLRYRNAQAAPVGIWSNPSSLISRPSAKEDRDGLVCKLNSYAQPPWR